MTINGVRVSVDPDIVFSILEHEKNKIGAVLLYTTMDEKKSLGRSIEGVSAGEYVAVLLVKMIEERAASIGVPLPKHIYVIDAWRKKVYTLPSRWNALYRDIEAACESIADSWKKPH